MLEHSYICRMGTRGSLLARWQTDHVAALLCAAWPTLNIETQLYRTQGDKILDKSLPQIGGKGVFTIELERGLHGGEIDLAVHSLKDLPTASPAGLTVGAVPQRAAPNDVLVSRQHHTLDTLPHGARVGTSSRRRAAQLLRLRPDLVILDIRGNIDTRIRKAQDMDGPYDAIVLAQAGVERLELLDVVSQVLPLEVMVPAPGQGAIGVQCRDERNSIELLRPVHHAPTGACVSAERAFLAALGGGCSMPIGAFAYIEDARLHLHGRVTAPDGSRQINVHGDASIDNSDKLGHELAQQALAEGARALLADIEA